MTEIQQSVQKQLARPFAVQDVKFKPQMVKGNRCLAMAYVDARVVEDRLDEVVGIDHWEDEYTVLNDGSVVCRLRVKFGDEWITKSDVGSPSEQPDAHDRTKAAFSDALKRAAVKFGIGRYLYRLPATWVDYDPVKKQITQLPRIPASATPQVGHANGQMPVQKPATVTVKEEWQKRLAAIETTEEMNALMFLYFRKPDQEKEIIRPMITELVNDKGWGFNEATQKFEAPKTQKG